MLDAETCTRYVQQVIRSFADKRTSALFRGVQVRGIDSDLQARTRLKLRLLDRARSLADLATHPGNRLEKLGGDRQGQGSIRVTDQWRICFSWADGDATEVWFGDYH